MRERIAVGGGIEVANHTVWLPSQAECEIEELYEKEKIYIPILEVV